jgi:hypothetical protein
VNRSWSFEVGGSSRIMGGPPEVAPDEERDTNPWRR